MSTRREKFENYDAFVDKFKPKKTTDDCYTPDNVYKSVSEWVTSEYNLNPSKFCRPFYPGGDYEHYDYTDKVVVDNPPFSILSQIINFYIEHGIRFFLFSPTLAGLVSYSDICTSLAVGVDITYENGATISTSFVTNLEPENIRLRTSPTLYKAVHEANAQNRRKQKKQLPKYEYPINVVSAANVYPYSKSGIDFVITRDESVRISSLDAQKENKKVIFGCGLIISDRLKAEREKAEREKAEREKAEHRIVWELSDREQEIINELNKESAKNGM